MARIDNKLKNILDRCIAERNCLHDRLCRTNAENALTRKSCDDLAGNVESIVAKLSTDGYAFTYLGRNAHFSNQKY